ncbi:MAG: helix-turn-helix transcriptional regulator [Candidatus Competibacteraceae bacterium]|nr:helix-turn-helix transcriptional regulator [Candidatus Competibacteraceae bacterium]
MTDGLTSFQKGIANLVRECREEAGLTQAKLARLLDVDQSTISRLERGEVEYSVTMLYKIADVFDMDLELNFTARE